MYHYQMQNFYSTAEVKENLYKFVLIFICTQLEGFKLPSQYFLKEVKQKYMSFQKDKAERMYRLLNIIF